jgi:hypothetical protein
MPITAFPPQMLDILEDFLFSFQDPTGLLPDADADPQPDSGAAAASEANARWACSPTCGTPVLLVLDTPCRLSIPPQWSPERSLGAKHSPIRVPLGEQRPAALPCHPRACSHRRCSDEGGGGEASEGRGSEEEEDYVRGRRGSAIRYFRLDGSTKGWQRQAMMDSFNSLHCKVGAALS